MTAKPVVTGDVHEVGIDQLFFSTTDDRGVIGHSNQVFVDLSRYSRDRLTGTPHNIIRHPAMPGGAFRAMWSELEAGRPFAAYVRNLASDGSEYDVFATITPLADGGYLSVRTRPVCEDLFSSALKIYADAREAEDAGIRDGANRREAAETGLGRIAELLGEAGIGSYEEFQNLALPAEVERRESLSEGLPTRPDTTGPFKDLLDAVHGLAGELDSWMEQQGDLADLSDHLRSTSRRLEEVMDGASLSPQAVADLDASDPRTARLAELLQVWGQMQQIVRQPVVGLLDSLTRLDLNSRRTRFRIALARLHSTMAAIFAAELIDGGDDAQLSVRAIPDLIGALSQGVSDMEEQAVAHRELCAEVAGYIEQASRFMAIPRQLLMLWNSGDVEGLPERAAELSREVTGMIDTVGTELGRLDELAERCRSIDLTSGSAGLRQKVEAVSSAAAEAVSHASDDAAGVTETARAGGGNLGAA